MGPHARVDALQDENRRLRVNLEEALEREAQLEAALLGSEADSVVFKQVFGLNPQQTAIFAALMAREQCSLEALCLALPQLGSRKKDRDEAELVKVQICRARKLLRAQGIVISTIWGWGYRLTDVNKAKVWRAVEAAKGGDA
ncbi:MAG: hypothetical protein AAF234_16065 [Pseudomonadota bacterium]